MGTSLKINLIYKPLEVSCAIEAANGVPMEQSYSAGLGAYTPDYSLTPLVLSPRVTVVNSGAGADAMPTGDYASALDSFTWEESTDGSAWSVITVATAGYAINPSGSANGSLEISKNAAAPRAPLMLRFKATLADARQPGIYHPIQMQCLITCVGAPEQPILTVDAPTWTFYNPMRSQRFRAVKSSFTVSGGEPGEGTTATRWLAKSFSGDAWHILGTGSLDYWAEEQADGSVEVDLLAMGDTVSLRIEGAYDPYGSPSLAGTAPGEADICAECSFRRRIPPVRWDMQRVGAAAAPGATVIRPVAVLSDGKGIIPDPEQYYDIKWTLAKGTSTGRNQTAAVAGRGAAPAISIASLGQYGGTLALEPADLGAMCAWADGDGKMIADADGKILLIQ